MSRRTGRASGQMGSVIGGLMTSDPGDYMNFAMSLPGERMSATSDTDDSI